MKRFQKITKGVLYTLLCVVALSSCGEYGRCDGMILTDTRTGQKYIIEHQTGYHYTIKGETVKIFDGDTLTVYELK